MTADPCGADGDCVSDVIARCVRATRRIVTLPFMFPAICDCISLYLESRSYHSLLAMVPID